MKILESEYNKALDIIATNQKIVDQYLEYQKCKCENLIHQTKYNQFPYGESYDYDECTNCGKTFNFKMI